jgi:O-antigen/teichoic acid export membrane protein
MVEFNKMFVMLPVMFLARKLDGEDPKIVYSLRIAYVVVQIICVLAVGYTYLQASAVAKSDASTKVVYVPPAAAVSTVVAKSQFGDCLDENLSRSLELPS